MIWLITDKGDPVARQIVDGVGFDQPPHYSRVTPGARQFTRNGQNLVFLSEDLLSVWVTFRPTPGKAVRMDGLDAWECALFCRRVGRCKASAMIREAAILSSALWGPQPKDGFITYIRPDRVGNGKVDHVVGYCYRRAGWRHVGQARDGKPMFQAPRLDMRRVPSWTAWQWHGDRGGKMRRELEAEEATEIVSRSVIRR